METKQPKLVHIDDRCDKCETARATFEAYDRDGTKLGKFCTKDATAAIAPRKVK